MWVVMPFELQNAHLFEGNNQGFKGLPRFLHEMVN
jgi:hypothetical protein